jgi:hypothetical protein
LDKAGSWGIVCVAQTKITHREDSLKHVALLVAAAALPLLAAPSLRAETVDLWKTTPPYPDVVNASHATPEAATFFKSYFTAKSEHKPVPTTDHFSDAHLTYIDAALGWPFYNKKGMTEISSNSCRNGRRPASLIRPASAAIRIRHW